MATERPISFACEGVTLRGILHEPAAGPVRAPILFLHGWGGYRIGPHRLFVTAARRFAALGHPCLRIDFRGRGDSDGAPGDTTIGTMIADALAAAAFLTRAAPGQPLILAGICSGAKVAMGACNAHPSIGSLILWSAEAMAGHGQATRRTRRIVRMLTAYAAKLANPATWRKILTLRVNTRMVGKAVAGRSDSPREEGQDRAILAALSRFGGPTLFVYGAADPESASARDQFAAFCRTAGARATVHAIAEADHNFCAPQAESELLSVTDRWLRDSVAPRREPPA